MSLLLLDDVLLDDVLLDELLLVALANRSASENPVLLVDELLAEEASPSIKISISKPVPLADELELERLALGHVDREEAAVAIDAIRLRRVLPRQRRAAAAQADADAHADEEATCHG